MSIRLSSASAWQARHPGNNQWHVIPALKSLHQILLPGIHFSQLLGLIPGVSKASSP
jgi:hypothetical protein